MMGFKPMGVPIGMSEHISVQFEEYEALRLADYENLSHEEAAKQMNVSRPTFTRMYEKIRKKLAQAFVEGKTILIEGGNVEFDKQWFRCTSCHTVFHVPEGKIPVCTSCGSREVENINESLKTWNKREKGRWGHGWNKTSEKSCICPSCKTLIEAEPGIPCRQLKCPKCGTYLTKKT
jgi:predicted DNA-binding protein (UPF0251 family)